MNSSDEDLNQSSGDEGEGGRDLEYNLERAKERVKGLKETVSHLEAFTLSAKKYTAEKDEEIVRLKKTLAELEGQKAGEPVAKQNGAGAQDVVAAGEGDKATS